MLRSYRENTRKLRDLLRDRPIQPMNEAIWWIEHVIRHRGAPHLRTQARTLSWYIVELVDIIVFCIVILLFITWLLYHMAKATIKFSFNTLKKVNYTTAVNKYKKT